MTLVWRLEAKKFADENCLVFHLVRKKAISLVTTPHACKRKKESIHPWRCMNYLDLVVQINQPITILFKHDVLRGNWLFEKVSEAAMGMWLILQIDKVFGGSL